MYTWILNFLHTVFHETVPYFIEQKYKFLPVPDIPKILLNLSSPAFASPIRYPYRHIFVYKLSGSPMYSTGGGGAGSMTK